MSGKKDQADSTYQPAAEVKNTRKDRYELRLGRSTVVISESDSDCGDELIAGLEVKVEDITEETRVESPFESLGVAEGRCGGMKSAPSQSSSTRTPAFNLPRYRCHQRPTKS